MMRIVISINESSEYERKVTDALSELPYGFKKRLFFDCFLRNLLPPNLSREQMRKRVERMVDRGERFEPNSGEISEVGSGYDGVQQTSTGAHETIPEVRSEPREQPPTPTTKRPRMLGVPGDP